MSYVRADDKETRYVNKRSESGQEDGQFRDSDGDSDSI